MSFDSFMPPIREMLSQLQQGGKVNCPRSKPKGPNLKRTIAHRHQEIFFQISGRTQFIFPNEKMLLNPGEVMLMPAAFPHGELGYGGETEFKQLAFMLMQEKVVVHFGVAPNHGGIPSMAESFSWSMKRLPWYENMLEEVIAEVEDEGVSSLGRDLLCSLVQLLLKEMIDGGTKRSWHPFVSTAINYFYHELSSHDLSVQSVAKVCGCSSDYLSRLFKRELGVSPQAFLQQRRIELAKNLLIQNSFNVSEVSRLCGFDRPAYFSTVFLSHVGVSPKAYQMKRSATDAQCIKR